MTTRIKLRRDTAANWLLANPILAAGEPGLETDTGKIKYGDGVTHYADLAHAGGDILVNDKAVTVTAGDDTKWIAVTKRDDEFNNTNTTDGTGTATAYYDNAGNIIVIGYISQNDTYNMTVAKYTPAGVCSWKKSLVEVNNDFSVYIDGCMAIDSNDNIIVALQFDGDGGPFGGSGLLKLDTDGEPIWCKAYQDTIGGHVILSVDVDSSNNIFITSSNYAPGGVIGLAKINGVTGSPLWSKQLGNASDWSAGTSLAIDYLNNIYVAGYVEEGNSEDNAVCVVAKLDSTGTPIWRKSLNMPDHAVDIFYTYPAGIDVDPLGNVYITGNYMVQSPNTDADDNVNTARSTAVFVTKLNTSGSVQWSRRAGPGPCDWSGLSTTIGEDGDLYLAAATTTRTVWDPTFAEDNKDLEKGFYEHNLILARYNSGNGDVVWQKYFNNRHQQINTFYGGPWGGFRSIDVHNDKLVIGGSSQLAFDYGNYSQNTENWSSGWVAQLSTDGAVGFDLADFKFVDSRVPGRFITITATDNTTLTFATGSLEQSSDFDGIPTVDAPISSTTVRSKSNTWTFDSQGNMKTPAEGNLVLDQTELGYINFMGNEDNYSDDIWFQSVVGDAEGFTYAVGADYWDTRRITVHKFDPQGKRVWGVQLRSGSGSVWDISKDAGVYTIQSKTNSGYKYRVGDTVVISGSDLGGDEPENNLTIEVTEVDNGYVDGDGQITQYSIQSGTASAGTDTYYGREDNNDDGESRPNSITIDPVTGNLHVVGETYEYDGDTSVLYLVLDSESGAVLSNKEIHNPGKDIYPYDIQVNSAGVPAIVGQEYGLTTDVLTMTAATNIGASSQLGQIIVGKETITVDGVGNDGRYPGVSGGSDWFISGTGISGQAYIWNFNGYRNMSTTTRQGSGAAFTVEVNAGSYSVLVTNGGTNYLAGHKILVSGSALGGTTPENDVIITVDAVDAGAITSVSRTGTANVAAIGPYTAVAFTNYQVGNGNQLEVFFNPETGVLWDWGVNVQGNDYVVGDVLTIPGTQFPGSATPANDVVFTVVSTSGGSNPGDRGSIYNVNKVGNPGISTDYLGLLVNGYDSYDFTVNGTWQLLESKDAEAFIWTPTFQKVFGGVANDWFTSVAWQGTTAIFAAGSSHNTDSGDDENVIVKMSNTGTVAWTKQLTHPDYDGETNIHSIGAMADGVVAVGSADDWQTEEWTCSLHKLGNAGNLLWHKQIEFRYNSVDYATLAVDPATDDFIVAINGYNNEFDTDAIHLFKFDKDGNIIWKRLLTSGLYDEFQWDNGYRALHIAGDRFFFAGNTYWAVDDYSNAWSASLPLDGTGVGEHGIWTYKELTDNDFKTYDKSQINGPSAVTTHPLTNAVSTNIAINNARFYYTDYPEWQFPIITSVIRNKLGGAIVFPDGSKQTTSAGISQQIRVARDYRIAHEDAGGHVFVDSADTDYGSFTVRIPYWESVRLPVGFKFTIINRSDHNIYIYTDEGPNNRGKIYGVDGNGNYTNSPGWYMNGDSDGANWVELIKVKDGFNVTDNNRGDEWAIRGIPNQFGNDW